MVSTTTTTPPLTSLSADQRSKANQGIGAAYEANLNKLLAEALPGMGSIQLSFMGAAVKQAFRGALGGMFGTTKDTGVGTGTAPGGSPSLKYSVGFSTGSTPKVGFSINVLNKLLEGLDPAINTGLLGAGFTQTQRQGYGKQIKIDLTQVLSDAIRSALGPDPGYSNGKAYPIVSVELSMELHKEWLADVTLDIPDDQDPPTGTFVMNLEGVEFRGTIQPERTGRYGGYTHIRVVGGAGGLTTELAAKNYSAGVITVRTVLNDILRECGEALSPDAKDPTLDKQLPNYQRPQGLARDHLTILGGLLGINWRVLRDGTIWVGVEGWPEQEIDDPVVEEHHGDGFMVSAPQQPVTFPGTVIRGQRIEQVVHRMDRNGLRSEHHARSVRSAVRKFHDEVHRKIDYTKRYPCKVVTQNADGTVDVLPDDAELRGHGLGHCAIYVGLPGTVLKVPQGAECLVAFAAGDPTRAYVDAWRMGTPFSSIDIG